MKPLGQYWKLTHVFYLSIVIVGTLVWIIHVNKKGNLYLLIFLFPLLHVVTNRKVSDPFSETVRRSFKADNSLPSGARDPLIYSFIKSVNEKTDERRDSVNVIRKNSQHGWKSEIRTFWCKNKKLITYPLLQNCWFFFNHHQEPRQSSTVQVRREGRGDNCKKNLSIIIIIINNNDKWNKNISNRQTQSPQYKTRFCHGHNNQRKVVFFFSSFFLMN